MARKIIGKNPTTVAAISFSVMIFLLVYMTIINAAIQSSLKISGDAVFEPPPVEISYEKNNYLSTQYLVVEVYDHLASNGAAINEIEVYDSSNNKLSYSLSTAYDSATNGYPYSWFFYEDGINLRNIWNFPKLYDGKISYSDNLDGAASSTAFLYESDPNSGHWARFPIDLGSVKDLGSINFYVGGSDLRIPKSVSFYTTDKTSSTDIYDQNIKVRNDDGLTLIKKQEFSSTFATPTKYEISKNEVRLSANIFKENEMLKMEASAEHVSGVLELKGEAGQYDKSYFVNNGTPISVDGTVNNAPWDGGWYTIYAKAGDGTETILQIYIPDKPKITLNGTNPVFINLDTKYIESGATVSSDLQSDIVATVTNSPSNEIGKFIVKYNAVDAWGRNADEVERTVYVVYSNLIFDFYDHLAEYGTVINEIEIYDMNNNKLPYSLTNVYDSTTKDVPYYWNATYWPASNLYDGEISYSSNSNGSANCTIFNYGSAAGSGAWSRLVVTPTTTAAGIGKIRIAVGGVEGRTPREISVYSVGTYNTTVYDNNIKIRDNTGLISIGTLNFSQDITTPTWFEVNAQSLSP